MMIASIKMQMSGMMKRKMTLFVYFLLMALVMVNFFSNVAANSDLKYVTEMPNFVKKLTLSDYSGIGYYMMQYYPILVVLPTACAYLTDRDSGMDVYIQSRVGKRNYWYGKMITVFTITFLMFTLPFLIETFVGSLSFSFKSDGDPSGLSYIDTIEQESRYFLSGILFKSRVLYAVVNTVIFGVISGILAVFNFSVTTLPVFKYKVLAFFPIYLVTYIIIILQSVIKLQYSMNYSFILRMFNETKMNYQVYGIFFAVMLLLSVVLVETKVRRDEVV